MNKRKITTRRRPAPKDGKILRAITKKDRPKKKLRAVAAQRAADFSESNTGLSNKIVGGLFILLLFHLIAVGSIALHSKYYKGSVEAEKKAALSAPLVQSKAEQTALDRLNEETPKISKNEAYTLVRAGETYQAVADRKNVNIEELKKLNKNRALHAGLVLKIPTREVKVVSPAVDAIGQRQQPTVHKLDDDVHVIVDGQNKPQVQVSAKATETKPSNYKTHTFKSGETFWALSKKYNVSVDAIKNANPKMNPTKIRVGDQINIPQ